MSGLQVERIQGHMIRLKLFRTAPLLEALLQEAAKKELSYSDFLEELFTSEVASKQEKKTAMLVAMAHFPFQKSLESFDFKFQPSLDPKLVRELSGGRFIAEAENVLLLGQPGVGKTHLAVGLGLKACALGYRTLFTTGAGLIATLTRAQSENRLEDKLKQLASPRLLIVDEIGYLPMERPGANLFFQLVSRRYERGSILITTNQSLAGWGEVFGDPLIATAILDRLLHHSTTINIKGESFRLKEKKRAGLLGRAEVRPAQDNELAPETAAG